MGSRAKVVVGLAVFIVLVTFPIWHSFGAGRGSGPPDVELPADATQCVEGAEWMVAHHPALLTEWRDAVVRDGRKEYTSRDFGTKHEMSLTKSCMGCHSNRQTFCARCHDYANVQLTCWGCHIEPRGN